MAILIIFKKYIYKVKKFHILLVLIIFNIFKNIIKKRFFLADDTYYINKYLTLKDKSACLNETLIIKEKKNILKLFSECGAKNITSVDTLFLAPDCKFGNCLVVLNIHNLK